MSGTVSGWELSDKDKRRLAQVRDMLSRGESPYASIANSGASPNKSMERVVSAPSDSDLRSFESRQAEWKAKVDRASSGPHGHTNSLLGTRIIRHFPKDQVNTRCVGCGTNPETPRDCYMGSVLTGVTFRTIKGTAVSDIEIIEETPQAIVIRGGEVYETERKFGFMGRKRGLICPDCASNFRGQVDKFGTWHPYVKIDGRVEGFHEATKDTFSSSKGFSKRVKVRGNHKGGLQEHRRS